MMTPLAQSDLYEPEQVQCPTHIQDADSVACRKYVCCIQVDISERNLRSLLKLSSCWSSDLGFI